MLVILSLKDFSIFFNNSLGKYFSGCKERHGRRAWHRRLLLAKIKESLNATFLLVIWFRSRALANAKGGSKSDCFTGFRICSRAASKLYDQQMRHAQCFSDSLPMPCCQARVI